MRVLRVLQLRHELVPYLRGLQLQRALEEQVAGAPPADDALLLLQHSHVYTLGKRATVHNVLLPPDELRARGVELHVTDRGGDATYHGPGQLVAYPIVHLRRLGMGVRAYVEALEDAVISAAQRGAGVAARGRVPGATGVWVGERKIAQPTRQPSRRSIASHGLALNVAPDLRMFAGIVPCGITDKEVSSLEREAGRAVPLWEMAGHLTDALARELRYDRVEALELPQGGAGSTPP